MYYNIIGFSIQCKMNKDSTAFFFQLKINLLLRFIVTNSLKYIVEVAQIQTRNNAKTVESIDMLDKKCKCYIFCKKA